MSGASDEEARLLSRKMWTGRITGYLSRDHKLAKIEDQGLGRYEFAMQFAEIAEHNERVADRWFRFALFTNTIWVLWTVMR